MSTLSDLQRFVDRHHLLPAGACVVVGVSGGPDSLALLHALGRLAPARNWQLQAAYLHHGLRAEADDESRFVAEVAGAWGWGCTIERADVHILAAQPGVSIEEAARQLRYAFLARTARRLGAGFVAVGHNADDQAETVLMHLLRGSGLAGLRGMSPSIPLADLQLPALPADQRPDCSGIKLIRPWLETSRGDIVAYGEANGLAPRTDATNTDTTYFRNRLRHEVIPLLRQVNPNLDRTLGRTASALQGEYEILSAHRDRLWQALAHGEAGRVRFDLSGFRDLAPGDQRALLRRAIATLRPHLRNISWEHTEGLLEIVMTDCTCDSGGPFPLVAGVDAWLNYGWLDVVIGNPATTDLPHVDRVHELRPPAALALGAMWQLVVRRVAWTPADAAPWETGADASRVWLPLDIPLPLLVRPRHPGDRLRVFGLGGSKTVTDLMTELKLPRGARPTWPLLVSGEGDVLWLAGKRSGEGCRLPPSATAAWEARLVWVGFENQSAPAAK